MRLTRTAAAALIIALVVILGFVPHPPAAEGAAISSVRSGRWSEPATWSCACVPGPGDSVTVGLGHVVGLIGDNEAFSVRIEAGGKLVVSRLSASSLTLRNNLIVEGTLDLGTDASPVTMPVLVKWTGINEAAFVGGDALTPLATDPGLWVQVDGRVFIRGSARFPTWTRAAGALSKGATQITLAQAVAGWRVGDEVAITPTLPPTAADYWKAYDYATITAISGKTLTLSAPLAYDHPAPVIFGVTSGAEVLNLTRNVRLEGEPTGRTHLIWNRTLQKQTLRYFSARWMGPQKDGAEILGRWAVHVHKAVDASRGSLIDGAIVRDAGGWAFVPHRSHGTTWRWSISHNVNPSSNGAFAWDPNCTENPDGTTSAVCVNNMSHDTLWQHNVASATGTGGIKGGFALAAGLRNRLLDSVAVGGWTSGNAPGKNAAAVQWKVGGGGKEFATECPPDECGAWDVQRVVAHNNGVICFRIWHNGPDVQVNTVNGNVCYHNLKGLLHGAYSNAQSWFGIDFYGNLQSQVELHATVNVQAGGGQTIRNIRIDAAGLTDCAIQDERHVLGSGTFVRLENLDLRGYKVAALCATAPNAQTPDPKTGLSPATLWEVEGFVSAGLDVRFENVVNPLSVIRLKLPGGGATEYRRADQCANPDPARNACVTQILGP